MMRGCPLPVDWLDYLDEERPDLKDHLDECLTCQALVASLRSQPVASIDHGWAKQFVGKLDAVWHEDRPATPAIAEFWFSAADFALASAVTPFSSQPGSAFTYEGVDRLLVLVVSHPTESDNLLWLDVVPVLSDVERATETDVLFTADENSLGAPWRALFANQCKVAREQLDTRVGSLWEAGRMVLTAAFDGELDERRWGAPLQHPYDPRAFLGEELDEAFLRLRTPWLLVCDSVDEGEQSLGPYLVRDAPSESEHGKLPANVFSLQPMRDPPKELALAASSSPTPSREIWALDSDDVKLVGKLYLDYAEGVLFFVVQHVQLKAARRLRLHLIAFGQSHESAVFAAVPDIKVSVAKQVPIDAVEDIRVEVVV